MPRIPFQTLPAPLGMGTALDPAELPPTRARLVRGFTPARNGRMKLSTPLQRILQTDFLDSVNFGTALGTVTGVAYYYNPQPPSQSEFNQGFYRRDRLVVVKNGIDVYIHTVAFDITTMELNFGAAVFVGQLRDVKTGGRPENQNIRTVQYKDEMFIVAGDGSLPSRFFLYPPSDTPFLYPLGITQPAAAPVPSNLGPGNVNGAVIYYQTDGDEKGRESSPSAGVDWSPTNQQVRLTFTWPSDLQVVTKYLYRTTAGGSIGYRIATISSRATTTYDDNALDANITSNAQMPAIGSNEPPQRASCLEIHKSRLFLNNRHIYDDSSAVNTLTQLQMSNLDAPTQFNAVPANNTEDESLGLQMVVGNRDSDEITGLRSNGSILAIPTRTGWYHLYGDDFSSSPFTVRFQHNRGCVSIDSLVEGDGLLFFLGEDGIYMTAFADGFQPRKMSLEIDDRWNGNLLALFPP